MNALELTRRRVRRSGSPVSGAHRAAPCNSSRPPGQLLLWHAREGVRRSLRLNPVTRVPPAGSAEQTPAKPPAPASRTTASKGKLLGERIGTQLDVHRARLRALAAFHQPWRAIAARAPEPASLPAGVRIVDAPVHPLGEETHWVRNAQHDHLPVLERDEAAVQVAGGDWNVLA